MPSVKYVEVLINLCSRSAVSQIKFEFERQSCIETGEESSVFVLSLSESRAIYVTHLMLWILIELLLLAGKCPD